MTGDDEHLFLCLFAHFCLLGALTQISSPRAMSFRVMLEAGSVAVTAYSWVKLTQHTEFSQYILCVRDTLHSAFTV